MTESKQSLTLQRIFQAVKRAFQRPFRHEPALVSASSSAPTRARRSPLEGVEVALVAVGIAALSALLAAPRATGPDLLPLPLPDRRTLTRVRASDADHARSARVTQLPFEIRAVGELMRRVGAASASGTARAAAGARGKVPSNLLADLRAAAERALANHGAPGLLALRGVQAELFIEATREWERGGKVSEELRELGGDFPELARESRWLDGRRLVLDEDERALLFRARFGDLSGLGKKPPFAASLDERRAGYALLLRHPAGADAASQREAQLGVVAALAKIDPNYPAAYARGVLYYRGQAFGAAADAFRAHLATRNDGPWTLRAKNHLLSALAQMPGEE